MRIIEDKTEIIVNCPSCKSVFAYNKFDIKSDFIELGGNIVKLGGNLNSSKFIVCPCCQEKIYIIS